MKFTCISTDLTKCFLTAKKAISASPSSPIMSGLHMVLNGNTLTCIGMDLNYSIRATLTVEGTEDGDVLLPATLSADLLNKLEQETVVFTFADTAQEALLNSSSGKFRFPVMTKEQFPEFATFAGENKITLTTEKLSTLIKKTSYACSTDNTRPLFTGVYFDKRGSEVTCVGTNTHRLAIKKITLADADNTEYAKIIPARLLKDVSATLSEEIPEEIVISFKERQVMIQTGNVTFVSNVIEGKFPDYRQVIPKAFTTTATFTVSELEKSIRRVATFSSSDYKVVKFYCAEDGLTLTSSSNTAGDGREKISIELQGEAKKIAFNSQYVLDVLKYIGTEKAQLQMNTSLSPACIIPLGEEDYIYIITPMRVQFE